MARQAKCRKHGEACPAYVACCHVEAGEPVSFVERPENNPTGIGLIMCAVPVAQHDVEDLFLVCGYCAEANRWLAPSGLRVVHGSRFSLPIKSGFVTTDY